MAASVAILLTPPGPAALAVLRIRGPEVEPFLAAHFSRPAKPGRAVHGELSDGDRVIDDPVAALHEDQQTADISLHGGPWVLRSAIDLLRRSGFDIIESCGETLPAMAIDAATPLEREVLTHLPRAKTELALQALLAQPRAWEELQRELQGLDRAVAQEKLRAILDDPALDNLLRLPRVAIIGPPNVGKSTLANQLFAQERSITAHLPGTTRDWVGATANIDGLAIMLVDTPGQRTTADEIEHRAIEASRRQIQEADLVIAVTAPDAPTVLPERIGGRAVLHVLNKADLAASGTLDAPVLPTVATTGQGLPELRRAIRRHFGCADLDPAGARIWTARQRDIVTRALHDSAALSEL